MAIAQVQVNANIDLIDSKYNTGGALPYIQGSDAYSIVFTFTQNNEAITSAQKPLALYIVTSDLLDFRQSVRFVKNVTSDGGSATLKFTLNPAIDRDLLEVFSHYGKNQIIFYIGETVGDETVYSTPSTPWEFTVYNNPVFPLI